ncbi:MAG: hypothetical protein U0932_08020 [Thiobacillus sp.]|nr:hypothetical protein [Thiobacillus sp.]
MKTVLTLIALVLAPYAMGAQETKNSSAVPSAQKDRSCISAKPVEPKIHEITVHCGPTAAPQPVAEPKLSISIESVITFLLGIPIGLISGLYTGMIVTRYARFAELRNEALRIVRAIDYMSEEKSVRISNDEDVPKLLHVSSDLLFLSHKEAGEQVSQLLQEIRTATDDARRGTISSTEYGGYHVAWQRAARELPPSKKVLWALWGNI